MSATKKQAVTNEYLLEAINEFRTECKIQQESTLFKMECLLIRNPTTTTAAAAKPKKQVVKKESAVYSNTMYWWIGMYASDDVLVSKCTTPEEVKIAEDSITGVKDKTEGIDRKRAIASALWKGFPKTKKSGELRTLYDAWKKGNAKQQATDVEKEKNTDEEDDEKDEECVNDEEDE
jgi:hypothetical protein